MIITRVYKIITGKQDEIKKKVEEAIRNNIAFKLEYDCMGYNGDDFAQGNLTVRLRIVEFPN